MDSAGEVYTQTYILEGKFDRNENKKQMKQRPRTSVANYKNRILCKEASLNQSSLYNDPAELVEMRRLGTGGSLRPADFHIYI
jgi:hypothetical protein